MLFKSDEHILHLLLILLSLTLLTLPLALLFNLNSEGAHLQLFLHNPQSIYRLIGVKIVFCLLLSFVYVGVVVLLYTFFTLFYPKQIPIFSLMIMSFYSVVISIYPAMILLFLWTLHQIWQTYIGMISILFVILTLFSGSLLFNWIEGTNFYTRLFEWGNIFTPANITTENDAFTFTYAPMYTGTFLLNGMVSVMLYVISCYLMDKKVEV